MLGTAVCGAGQQGPSRPKAVIEVGTFSFFVSLVLMSKC